MNESKSIDNPRIKIVKSVGAKAQDVKMRWYKNNNRRSFFLTDKRNRHVANLPVVDFRSQLREMPLPKPLNT